jgi:hypothetical protein
MKERKRGLLIALAAVLLISAVLVTSCQEIILQQPSGDMGVIRLNIGNDFGRTVFPTAPTFPVYEVIFTAVSGGTSRTVDVTTANPTIELVPGIYSVVVNAYLEFTPPTTKDDLAATGASSSNVTIVRGSNTPISINLAGFSNGDEEGTLNWVFNFPDAPDSATIDIISLPGTTSLSGYPVALVLTTPANVTGTATIDSGYYLVVVTMEKAGYRNTVIEEIVHIYDFMTSTYNRTFPAMISTLGTIVVNITFNISDQSPVLDGPVGFIHDLDSGLPATLVIEITNDIFTGGSVVWKYNGDELTEGVDVVDQLTFTLDFADDTNFGDFLFEGIHTITVIATTAAGVPYSASYTFEVTN